MYTHRIELTAGTSLEVAGEGNLSIQGLDEPVLLVQVSEETDADIQQTESKVMVHLEDDGHLHVWRTVAVTVSQLEGDLVVRGLSAPFAAAQVEGDAALSDVQEVRLENVEGDVAVSRGGDVQVRGCVDGDVALRQVGGVELGEVEGDLAVHGAAALSVERTEDDLVARMIAGPVRLNEVDGDVALREVEGAVEIGRVNGDLSAHDLRGDLVVTRVDGDVSLNVAFKAGQQYRLAAEGDIAVRFPEGTAARFIIQARRWVFPPASSFQVESQEEGHAVVQLGQGGPEVFLVSDHDVTLGPVASDWERSFNDFSRRMEGWGEELRRRFEHADWERVGREIEEATARIAQVVESRVQEIDPEEIGRRAQEAAAPAEERLSSVDWERIGKKVERAVAQSMDRVQAGLQRLQEKLQRRTAEGSPQAAPVPPVAPVPPTAPVPPAGAAPSAPAAEAEAPGALSQEKMAVLYMVEQGLLTAEEAAALLDTLGNY